MIENKGKAIYDALALSGAKTVEEALIWFVEQYHPSYASKEMKKKGRPKQWTRMHELLLKFLIEAVDESNFEKRLREISSLVSIYKPIVKIDKLTDEILNKDAIKKRLERVEKPENFHELVQLIKQGRDIEFVEEFGKLFDM